MVWINHQTPSNYTNRHRDWYQGVFQGVVHAFALSEEYRYYLSMEKECVEINAWFAADFLGILSWLKNFLIDTKRKAYQNGYVDAYDQAALSACKVMESTEGQAKELLNSINNAYNKAISESQKMVTNVSDYINKNITPALSDAQTAVSNIKTQVNGVVTQINGISSQAQSALNNAKTALSNADSAVNYINNTIVPSLNNKTKQIDSLLSDAQSKASQISVLGVDIGKVKERLAALEKGQTVTTGSTSPTDSIKDTISSIFRPKN